MTYVYSPGVLNPVIRAQYQWAYKQFKKSAARTQTMPGAVIAVKALKIDGMKKD